jgi:formylglycine-generating enzyme required for sulfatase activity
LIFNGNEKMKYTLVTTFSLALAMLSIPSAYAGKGMLKIATEPGDAKIYINGKRKGNSPSKKGQTFAIKLEEGEYKIEVIKATGGAMELFGENNDVFVAEDTLQTITLDLKERPSASFKAELAKKYAGGLPIPKMVNIPAGQFKMGCVSGKNCSDDEKPVHRVNVAAFAMSATEVTFEQWDACVEDGGCSHYPDDEGWGRGNRSVINVSFDDIQAYLSWLNGKGQGTFQLPSEAQWEYAARAGSNAQYSWGNNIGNNKANCGKKECGDSYKNTAPVGSFKPNALGLYDMHGNVWEWTQDCWNDSYKSAGSNDSPRLTGKCSRRVVRGGSWAGYSGALRAAYRNCFSRDNRYYSVGFRLSRSAAR